MIPGLLLAAWVLGMGFVLGTAARWLGYPVFRSRPAYEDEAPARRYRKNADSMFDDDPDAWIEVDE